MTEACITLKMEAITVITTIIAMVMGTNILAIIVFQAILTEGMFAAIEWFWMKITSRECTHKLGEHESILWLYSFYMLRYWIRSRVPKIAM